LPGGSPPQKPPPAPSLTSLFQALKIKPDSWSASILSFAKFFSLPLEGDLLARIRRQVLEAEAPAGESPAGEGGAEGGEFREALSLAALAARAKGLELSPKALADYARALLRGREPDSPEAGDEEDAGPPAFSKAPPETPRERLKARVLGAQGPLLSLLNKAPDREGRRWIVLPFSPEPGLTCCLRILLVPQAGPAAYRAERLNLDICGGEGPESPGSWSFQLWDSPRLEVFCRPAPGPSGAKALEGELGALLGLPPDSVRVREFPAFAEDCRDRSLPSVNEEV
jgi:hypothetical protein